MASDLVTDMDLTTIPGGCVSRPTWVGAGVGAVQTADDTLRRMRHGTERRRRAAPQIGVRLDPIEREALLLRAELAGLTPADYLRKRALGTAARIRRAPETSDDAMRKLLRQLIGLVGALGNNANQIAHAVNSAALAGQALPVGVDAVHDLNESVRAMRAELRTLAGIREVK